MQAVERPVVAAEREGVVGQMGEGAGAVQEVLQRVAVGLDELHRDIRGDARQHLVAGNQQFRFGAGEADMLRRMAGADDRLPLALADPDAVAMLDAAIDDGRTGHVLGVEIAAPAHGVHG